MSRLPASYLPAASRRRTASRPSPSRPTNAGHTFSTPTQPAHYKPSRSEPVFTPAPHRLWLVFLLGVIAGAAVLASQVSTFLYG